MKKKKLIMISLGLLLFSSCSFSNNQGGGNNTPSDNPSSSEPVIINVTSVSLNKSSLELYEGQSYSLTVSVLPSNATNKKVAWSSSDNNIATVSNGLITAKKEGSVAITVKSEDGNFTKTCNVVVKKVTSDITSSVAIGQSVAKLKNSNLYNEFFNNESSIKIKIEFEEKSLNYIEQFDEGTTKDYYFPCNVTFTINNKEYYFEEVGARRKGNMSIKDDFNNGKIHYKLSFKETFDDPWYKTNAPEYYKSWTETDPKYVERDSRTFLDMEKLDLKWNRNNDETHLRQSYSNYLFKSAGLMAQSVNIADVSVYKGGNKVVDEVYDVLECIDKTFLQRYFSKESAKGDLYKCGWNYSSGANMNSNAIKYENGSYTYNPDIVGIEDVTLNYKPIYDLKTNKKTSTHSDLVNFIKTINQDKSSGSDFENTFKTLTDLNYNAKVFAYSYALGDPDDFRCNYNNYYMYFEPTTHRMYLIPYDHDRSLGVNDNGGKNDMPTAWFSSTKAYGYSNNTQANPFIYRTCVIPSSGTLEYQVVPSSVKACKEELYNLRNSEILKPSSFTSYTIANPHDVKDATYSNGNNISYENYYNILVNQIDGDTRLSNYSN